MIVLLSQYVFDDPDNIESEIVSATQNRLKFIVVKLDEATAAHSFIHLWVRLVFHFFMIH